MLQFVFFCHQINRSLSVYISALLSIIIFQIVPTSVSIFHFSISCRLPTYQTRYNWVSQYLHSHLYFGVMSDLHFHFFVVDAIFSSFSFCFFFIFFILFVYLFLFSFLSFCSASPTCCSVTDIYKEHFVFFSRFLAVQFHTFHFSTKHS